MVIVGGGPTGLVSACLLGSAGVRTLLVERNPSTSTEAKAISIDDESLRVMQRAGVVEDVYDIIHPGTGTAYFGADRQLLFRARSAQPYRLGHPFKNPFAQPDFERVLLRALDRFPSVEVAFGTELVDADIALDADIDVAARARSATGQPVGDRSAPTATVTLRPTAEAGGSVSRVRTDLVLGCDGGRSTLRRLAGIAMVGRSFDDRWLVADTLHDSHRQRYGLHVGDPSRPHVIIPGGNGRCRYELKLRPDEQAATPEELRQLARRLIAPLRTLRDVDIERCIVYSFHALVAERWRHGPLFLLGDAAHMMPPFAGQGLNSGIRDADNLTWKVAAVLAGQAHRSILDTYETERRPHAEAMVRLSTWLGRVVMTSKPSVAQVRDATVRAALRSGSGRRYLTGMRFKPQARYRRGFVDATVAPTRRPAKWSGATSGGRALVGAALPQPRCLTSSGQLVLLDEVLGPWFALLGVHCPEESWTAVGAHALGALSFRQVEVFLDDTMAADIGPRTGVADADGALQSLLCSARGSFLLVRPDRFVAAAFDPPHLHAVVAQLEQYLRQPAPSQWNLSPSNPSGLPPRSSQ